MSDDAVFGLRLDGDDFERGMADAATRAESLADAMGELDGDLDVTSAQFQRAAQAADKFQRTLNAQLILQVGEAVGRLSKNILGIIDNVNAQSRAMAEAHRAIRTWAAALGTTSDVMTNLGRVARSAGLDLSAMGDLTSEMGVKAYDAMMGSEDLAKTFERLGVTITDANGDLKSNYDLLSEVTDALLNTTDSTLALAMADELGSDALVTLIGHLKAQSTTLDASMTKMSKYGQLTAEQSKLIDQLAASQADLNEKQTQAQMISAAASAPMMMEINEAIGDFQLNLAQTAPELYAFGSIIAQNIEPISEMAITIGSLVYTLQALAGSGVVKAITGSFAAIGVEVVSATAGLIEITEAARTAKDVVSDLEQNISAATNAVEFYSGQLSSVGSDLDDMVAAQLRFFDIAREHGSQAMAYVDPEDIALLERQLNLTDDQQGIFSDLVDITRSKSEAEVALTAATVRSTAATEAQTAAERRLYVARLKATYLRPAIIALAVAVGYAAYQTIKLAGETARLNQSSNDYLSTLEEMNRRGMITNAELERQQELLEKQPGTWDRIKAAMFENFTAAVRLGTGGNVLTDYFQRIVDGSERAAWGLQWLANAFARVRQFDEAPSAVVNTTRLGDIRALTSRYGMTNAQWTKALYEQGQPGPHGQGIRSQIDAIRKFITEGGDPSSDTARKLVESLVSTAGRPPQAAASRSTTTTRATTPRAPAAPRRAEPVARAAPTGPQNIYGPAWLALVDAATAMGLDEDTLRKMVRQGVGDAEKSQGTHLGIDGTRNSVGGAIDLSPHLFGTSGWVTNGKPNEADRKMERFLRALRRSGNAAFFRGLRDNMPWHAHIVYGGTPYKDSHKARTQYLATIRGDRPDRYYGWTDTELAALAAAGTPQDIRRRTLYGDGGGRIDDPLARVDAAQQLSDEIREEVRSLLQQQVTDVGTQIQRLQSDYELASLRGDTTAALEIDDMITAMRGMLAQVEEQLAEYEGDSAVIALEARRAAEALDAAKDEAKHMADQQAAAERDWQDALQDWITLVDREIEILGIDMERAKAAGNLQGADELALDIARAQQYRATLTEDTHDDVMMALRYEDELARVVRERADRAMAERKDAIETARDQMRAELQLAEARGMGEGERAQRLEELARVQEQYRNYLLATGDAIGAMRVELELLDAAERRRQELTLGQEIIAAGTGGNAVRDLLARQGRLGGYDQLVDEVLQDHTKVMSSILAEMDENPDVLALREKFAAAVYRSIETVLE